MSCSKSSSKGFDRFIDGVQGQCKLFTACAGQVMEKDMKQKLLCCVLNHKSCLTKSCCICQLHSDACCSQNPSVQKYGHSSLVCSHEFGICSKCDAERNPECYVGGTMKQVKQTVEEGYGGDEVQEKSTPQGGKLGQIQDEED